MKWFKHQSAARNDERISRLEDKSGLEGYGFYFKMLEIVAEVIDSTDRCEVTYSMSRWGRQTNVSTKKCLFLLQCCSDVCLMIVQRVGDDITVKIPNLLKYRDNHTKNLQGTSKQEVEEEEKKKEQNQEEPSLPVPPKKTFDDTDEMIAHKFHNGILRINPTAKPPNFDSWSAEISKIRRIDKRGEEEIIALFSWANQDPFWQSNILSPKKLREKWDQLTLRKNERPPPSKQSARENYYAQAAEARGKENGNSTERDITGEAERVA